MTKVLTTRVGRDIADRVEKTATILRIDKASFMRKILVSGLEQAEEEQFLKRYAKGEISLGKLTDLLGITKWDALVLLKEKDIHLAYDEKALEEDLSGLEKA